MMGSLQEHYTEVLGKSLLRAHACVLCDASAAVLSRQSAATLWRCVLSSFTTAHLRGMLCGTSPPFVRVQRRMLQCVDSASRAHADSRAPPGAVLLSAVISQRTSPAAESESAAAATAACSGALQLLPLSVKAGQDSGAAALATLPFVVSCMGSSAASTRAAAVDAAVAMHEQIAAADADVAPFVTMISNAREAVVASPDAFLEHLRAADLTPAARGATTRRVLRRPFTMASDDAAPQLAAHEPALLMDPEAHAVVAGLAFEVGLQAGTVHDVRAALSVHGASAMRLFTAAVDALEPDGAAIPAMRAAAAYVCRDGARLLREGQDAGELLGLAREALRKMSGHEDSRAAAIATVRVILADGVGPNARRHLAADARADKITSSLRCLAVSMHAVIAPAA